MLAEAGCTIDDWACRPRNSSPNGAGPRAPNARPRRSIFSICATCSACRSRPTSIRTAPNTPLRNRPGRSATPPALPMSGSGTALPGNTRATARNLVEAYAQLKQYADALENPPLLIVSRHAGDPGPHQFHQRDRPAACHRAIRPGLGRGAGVAAQLLSPSGAVVADPDAGERHGAGGGQFRQYRRAACAGITTSAASRILSTSWSSACSPKTSIFCPTGSSPTSSTRRESGRTISSRCCASCSAPWRTRTAVSGQRRSPGSMAGCSTMTTCCRSASVRFAT